MSLQQKIARYEPWAGSLALIITACVVLVVGWSYTPGKLTQMGPGYFPRIIGICLLGFGVLSLVMDVRTAQVQTGGVHWRNLAFVTASIVAFVALIDRAGLIPATFAAVALATFGDRQARLVDTLIYTLCVAALAWLLFIQVLGLPLAAFGRG